MMNNTCKLKEMIKKDVEKINKNITIPEKAMDKKEKSLSSKSMKVGKKLGFR